MKVDNNLLAVEVFLFLASVLPGYNSNQMNPINTIKLPKADHLIPVSIRQHKRRHQRKHERHWHDTNCCVKVMNLSTGIKQFSEFTCDAYFDSLWTTPPTTIHTCYLNNVNNPKTLTGALLVNYPVKVIKMRGHNFESVLANDWQRWFKNFPHVEYLDLSACQIRSLTDWGHYDRLSNKDIFPASLKILKLARNNIRTIAENTFKLGELRYIDLSDNQLSNIHPKAFSHLSNLKALRLSGNRLTSLDSTWFANLAKLQQLFLDRNQLSHSINFEAFRIFENLRTLTLSDNKITKTKHEWAIRRLSELDLSGNHFKQISPVLIQIIGIEIVKIDRNHMLGDIPSGTFSNSQTVIGISLNYNSKLEWIDKLVFQNLTKLRKLEIRHNGILSYLNEQTWGHLPALKELKLDHNNLKYLPGVLFTNNVLPALTSLSLQGNPLHCDCNMDWLFNVPAVTICKVGEETKSICKTPVERATHNLCSGELKIHLIKNLQSTNDENCTLGSIIYPGSRVRTIYKGVGVGESLRLICRTNREFEQTQWVYYKSGDPIYLDRYESNGDLILNNINESSSGIYACCMARVNCTAKLMESLRVPTLKDHNILIYNVLVLALLFKFTVKAVARGFILTYSAKIKDPYPHIKTPGQLNISLADDLHSHLTFCYGVMVYPPKTIIGNSHKSLFIGIPKHHPRHHHHHLISHEKYAITLDNTNYFHAQNFYKGFLNGTVKLNLPHTHINNDIYKICIIDCHSYYIANQMHNNSYIKLHKNNCISATSLNLIQQSIGKNTGISKFKKKKHPISIFLVILITSLASLTLTCIIHIFYIISTYFNKKYRQKSSNNMAFNNTYLFNKSYAKRSIKVEKMSLENNLTVNYEDVRSIKGQSCKDNSNNNIEMPLLLH